jgi:hypothetical protein
MNIAVGIGTLLLGGWVLNTPVEDLPPDQADQIPDIEVPFSHAAAHAAPSDTGSPRRNPNPERGVPRDIVQGQLRALKEPAARTGLLSENAKREALAKGLGTPQLNPQATTPKRAAWILPPAPTDALYPNLPGSMQFPLPPTVRESDLIPGPGPVDPYVSPNAPKPINIPPARQAWSPRTAESPSTYSEANDIRDRIAAATHPAYTDQPPPPKAFAEARPFSGGVSPYMNLFRNDTNGGTIDNYSTFVRPQLAQRSLNQQYNMDLWGLQRIQRIQNDALQQLGRNYSNAPQYIGTPQFYQNYGNYYQGGYYQGGYGQGGYGQGGYGQGGYGP